MVDLLVLGDAGVVHHDVEPAEATERPGRHVLDEGPLADVARHRLDGAAARLAGARHLGEQLAAPGAHQQRGAARGKS